MSAGTNAGAPGSRANATIPTIVSLAVIGTARNERTGYDFAAVRPGRSSVAPSGSRNTTGSPICMQRAYGEFAAKAITSPGGKASREPRWPARAKVVPSLQFLDIGSGIPTEQNVHEVAQAAASGARVVYVDSDEVAVAHSRLMLEDNPDATVIQADLREPAKILADPETQLLIDFTQPVALLVLAVLHFVPDGADPAQILATLRDAVCPGSYLVICHACRDVKPDTADSATTSYNSRGRGAVQGAYPGRDRRPVRRIHAGRAATCVDT